MRLTNRRLRYWAKFEWEEGIKVDHTSTIKKLLHFEQPRIHTHDTLGTIGVSNGIMSNSHKMMYRNSQGHSILEK